MQTLMYDIQEASWPWATLSDDLVTSGSSLFTETGHTTSCFVPLVMLLLLPELSLFILQGPKQISCLLWSLSWLSPGPTEVLSWVFRKHFCSYLCYRAYWNAFWRVGYVTVLLTLLGVLEDKVRAWFSLAALLAASTMHIVGIQHIFA